MLEKVLKIGIKLGDITLVGKNRYVPSTLVINLKISAEKLAGLNQWMGYFQQAIFETR